MVRSYVKYEQSASFGAITSSASNTVWTPSEDLQAESTRRSTGAGHAYAGANEEVLCWDVKKGELLSRWRDKDCVAEVTSIAQSRTDPDIFAVGYADGSLRLWDAQIATVVIRFDGHRSAVTALAFNSLGTRLASGGKDTDIIVWDLVSEVGLFKLRGHKDQITGLHFLQALERATASDDQAEGDVAVFASPDEPDGFLLSTSKDALIKVWDVKSQYCTETHVTQSNGECWALGVSPDVSGCITAGNDGELRVWSLDSSLLNRGGDDLAAEDVLKSRGILRRPGGDRATGVYFHDKSDYIAVHGSEKAVEIWRIRTPTEVQKALARKRRRKREKIKDSQPNHIVDVEEDPATADVSEVFVLHEIVRTGGKVRSTAWAGQKASRTLHLLVSTTNNQMETYDVSMHEKSKKSKSEEQSYTRTLSVELPGHRTDVRALALSSDDRMLASASSGSLKIWNVKTGNCLRTLDCGYALCSAFLPGDKIVVVGNKNGELELFDIAASTLIDTVAAHEGSIWTLRVHPDGKSLASGGADKQVKFWNFEIVQEEIPGTKRTTARLRLVQKRALKLNDDILSLCFSPDSRLLAVSTLDNTVKVFFSDTLKMFLNLYGHKLPVLSMAIASDSKLIVTCSADKNVRLWGLDFGDCHKALFAHDDSIMAVSFIPHPVQREDGHLFFSASKDGLVKTWDGDKFQHVQKLRGHHGEIWAMAVSRTGDFVVTASHDRSIRIWSQTDEPLFLEEERERDLEEMYDQNLTASLEKDAADEALLADGEGAAGGSKIVPASKQTAATLTAGEKIAEALTLCVEDYTMLKEYEEQKAVNPAIAAGGAPQRNPLLQFRSLSAEAYLLSVFEGIAAAALQDALLLLSFSMLPDLFIFLAIWLHKEMNVPLACRVLFFLLKTHHTQIVASRELRTALLQMRERLRQSLGRNKDVMGFNLAGVRILGQRVGEGKVSRIEDEQQIGERREKGRGSAHSSISHDHEPDVISSVSESFCRPFPYESSASSRCLVVSSARRPPRRAHSFSAVPLARRRQ